jgi:predicted MFS family arabinose efflux permease
VSHAPAPPLLTRPFLLVSLLSFAYFVADGTSFALVSRYATGPLGTNEFGAGLVYGAFSLSALVLRPLAGRLADRRGRRPLMVGGSALFGAVMLAHLFAGSIPILIGLRLALGVAEAMVFVAAFAAEADLAPEERRGEALTLFSLSLYAGIAVGPLIGEAVLGDGRWWAVWVTSGLLGFVAAGLGMLVPETRPTSGEVSDGGFFHRAGVLPGVVLLTGVLGMAGFFTLMPPFAVDELGLQGMRGYLLLFGGTVIATRILGAKLVDRVGARKLSGGSMLITAAGLATFWLAPTTTGLLIGTFLLALGVAFTTPSLAALTIARSGANERGAALGTFSVFIDLAFGVGPIALGAVASVSTTPAAFLFAAVVAVGGAALLWFSQRPAPVTQSAA